MASTTDSSLFKVFFATLTALSLHTVAAESTPSTSPVLNSINVPAYQDELKLYLPDGALQMPKTFDIMAPSSAATAESNLRILMGTLQDTELLQSLRGAKSRICSELKATTCSKPFQDLKCEFLNLQELRVMLATSEANTGRSQESSNSCVGALRKGLILFDVLVVVTALEHFQDSKQEDPRAALSTVFSALKLVPSPGRTASTSGEPSTVRHETGSADPSPAAFVEKLFRKKVPTGSADGMKPAPGTIGRALVTYPAAYLAFAGVGGPQVSLVINWLYQVFSRFDDFFGKHEGNRRPLAPLWSLLTEGHEMSLSRLYKMCGMGLGIQRKHSKPSPNALSLPREYFRRASYLVGLSRISCDVMIQALHTLHLAELNAIEHVNKLRQLLPPNQLELAVPLEPSAGGPTNLQRLCLGFRARYNDDPLSNLSCSFDDTMLEALEANDEGATTPVKGASFIDSVQSKQAAAPKGSEHAEASQNAYLAFSLLSVRAGNRTSAGQLLGTDAGSWWSLILLIDPRTSKEMVQGYTKFSKLCTKTVKRFSSKIQNADEEGMLCSSNWEKKVWEKKLHCPEKLLAIQCMASQNLYGVFEGGMANWIKELLDSFAKVAACGNESPKCPKSSRSKRVPFGVINSEPASFSAGLQNIPGGENVLRVFTLLSGNKLRNGKDILSGNDGVDVILRNVAMLKAERKTSILLSRWLPHNVLKLVKRHMGKSYSKRHFRALVSRLPDDFYMRLRKCIDVVIHPLVFVQLNQLSFTRSKVSGERSSAGGLSARLDKILGEAATLGLPQTLKEKFQAGETPKPGDYRGINFAQVKPPKASTWQEYLKLELSDSLATWMAYPENKERQATDCRGGTPSNILAIARDSMDLLTSSEVENLTLIGKVVSPKDTSVGKPGLLQTFTAKFLRMPPYISQHHSFVAVKVDIPEAIEAVRTIVRVYTENKSLFENQEILMKATTDLFAHYEQKYRSPSRGLLGVPENTLIPVLHPNYATMSLPERLRELKDSAMSQFFQHIWTLVFSVSANNILNATHLDSLEKTFTKEAWQKTINDPFQASSFGMILMGGDMGLKLFNQLLPTKQKRMLKKAKYGSPTVFTSQMQLTGSLLSASGKPGLGMFLHAQAVYFGVMIRRWINKRSSDRIREIISWLSLGLFISASFLKAVDNVTEIANSGNETGQSSATGGCPPMGICISDSGDAFVADPTGSPVLTGLQIVMKTGIMATLAVFAGPLVAVYNIAVSNFQILSRLEMAFGNAFKLLITKISRAKVFGNIKKMLQSKKGIEENPKNPTTKSLGDEVETSTDESLYGKPSLRD